MNPDDHHPARIRKNDNMFESKFDFIDIKFPIKIRDIHEIEKKGLALELAFLVMKIKKNTYFMSHKIVSKNIKKNTMFFLKILTHPRTIILSIVKKKTFSSFLFTSFQHRKNIKMSY